MLWLIPKLTKIHDLSSRLAFGINGHYVGTLLFELGKGACIV